MDSSLCQLANPEKWSKVTVNNIESFKFRVDYELAFDANFIRDAVSSSQLINTNRKWQGRAVALRAVSGSLGANLLPRTFASNSGVIERLGGLLK